MNSALIEEIHRDRRDRLMKRRDSIDVLLAGLHKVGEIHNQQRSIIIARVPRLKKVPSGKWTHPSQRIKTRHTRRSSTSGTHRTSGEVLRRRRVTTSGNLTAEAQEKRTARDMSPRQNKKHQSITPEELSAMLEELSRQV